MKSTKVTKLLQNGEGTMHEVPHLRTKVRGPDKGTDKPRPLRDTYGNVHLIMGLSTGEISHDFFVAMA